MEAQPCADTPLARLLHARGRLPLETIQAVLAETRQARPGGPGLAERLIERGLLDAGEAAEWAAQVGAPLWGPGAVVGEHRLLRRIGAGGMGTVDLAEHLPTGAVRAIKSLPVGVDPELALRFQREGEAMARVGRHPAVVRVHSLGQALGRQYLVMEHLEGGDLTARLRERPLPADEVARLGVTLARALGHVHACGVLHRDLKPSNVLFDGAGAPVLVDFGLARASGAQALTRTGDLLGTPAYMAPEQALGLQREQDARTDVYGLGALLYHALTGRPPFQGGSHLALLEQVVDRDPAPPRSLVPEVPPALERVILRALAKRPQDRWPGAEAMAEALEAASLSSSRSWRRVAVVTAAGLVGAALLVLAWPRSPAPLPAPSRPRPRPAPAPGLPAPSLPGTDAASPPEEPQADAWRGLPTRVEEIPRLGELPDWLSQDERRQLELAVSTGPAGLLVASTSFHAQAWDVVPPDPQDRRFALGASLLRELLATPDVEAGLEGRAWKQLHELFVAGHGVRPDEREALRCLARAVALGDGGALSLWGELFRDGRAGFPRDPARAAGFFQRSADAADNTDQRFLALQRLADLSDEAPEAVSPQRAVEAMRQAVALREHDPWARYRLAHFQLRAGQVEEARVALRELTRVPGVRVHALVALLEQAEVHDPPAAQDYRERLLTGQDWSRGDLVRLGDWHAEEGRPEEGARILLGVARSGTDPQAMSAAHRLLDLCDRQVAAGGQPPVSVREAEDLVARDPDGAIRVAQRRAAR